MISIQRNVNFHYTVHHFWYCIKEGNWEYLTHTKQN